MLLLQLSPFIDESRKIVLLLDKDKVTKEVETVADSFSTVLPKSSYQIERFNLANDFAAFKNFGNSKCTEEWIVQLDADEVFYQAGFIDIILEVLKANEKNVDILLLPRVNTVHGITLDHIRKWGWNISKINELEHTESLKFEDPYFKLLNSYNYVKNAATTLEKADEAVITYSVPIINFPDYQTRIYRNTPEIKWVGAVHERVTGSNRYALLPAELPYCLMHMKSIERQEAQNSLYTTINATN